MSHSRQTSKNASSHGLQPVKASRGRTSKTWKASFGVVTCASLLLAVGCKESDSGTSEAAKAPPPRSQPKFDGQVHGADGETVSAQTLLAKVKPLFNPLPEAAQSEDNPLTEEKIALGRVLYYETRLSVGDDISCNTCHDLQQYGIDPREQEGSPSRTSLGHKGQTGDRNSPTVYNAAFHIAQFWDGRANDVEAQAQMPITNPVEMAMATPADVEKKLQAIPEYVEMFKTAFPGEAQPITMANIGKAIGAFERKLVTPSRFDQFLSGDTSALKPEELSGLKTFVDAGCTQCHNGAVLGGTQFQKLGNVRPWPGVEDPGRAKITGSPADEHVFKVPSLRNITKTGPYLHDGSIDSLDEMVAKMAEYQAAGGAISDEKVKAIVAFLGSLEGEIPKEYIAEPQLPGMQGEEPAEEPS